MARDSSRFKLDPTIVALNSESAGKNYGHVISQAFKDLGDIENNKINLDLADTKKQYEEIKLKTVRDELDDDKTFSNYILAEDKNDFLKNNNFKTSKYSLVGEEYKNTLSQQEKDGHIKSALSTFTDEQGNFKREDAFSHLQNKFKDGTISEKQLYDITDAIDQKIGRGIYTPKLSMKDQMDILKTQSEIDKNIAAKNKYNVEAINVGNNNSNNTKDPLSKDINTFNSLIQHGVIDPNTEFKDWYGQGVNGKVSIKLENVTKAKDKLTEQFNGSEQILNVMHKYDPSKFGVGDGIIQKTRELTGIHSAESADLESDIVALKGATAKAVGGSNPSNAEQKMGEQIAGGTFNTEAGAAAKYKATLERAILSQQETINQIARAGHNTEKEQTQLNSYIDISNKLKDWNGKTTVAEHLAKKEKNPKINTNSNGTKIISDKTQKPQQKNTNNDNVININSVEDFDKLLGL